MALPPMDPQQRKNVLYGSLLLGLLAFGFYDRIYNPRKAEVAGLETRVEGLKNANARSRAITRGGEEGVNARLALYRQQLELAEGLIPSAEELPDLLDAISAEAQRTGVEIVLIQPVGASEEAYYTRRVYDMAVRGRYHQVGEFLARVASLPRIITPTGLTLSVATEQEAPVPGQPGRAGDPPLLEARFSVETYVIPSTPIEDESSA
ncbi:MAG TPA: type 4a pilus biogenesis protein PilO [Longimicrobium sp.]|nr:type 4a pilus biogenesis protein PilO [Longimicrobium sp.]